MPSKPKTGSQGRNSSRTPRIQADAKPASTQSITNRETEFDPYFYGAVARCGAKTRAGKPCTNLSMENGRCRMHGGKSKGAPEGNKNGMVHGAYERILFGVLNDEEIELWENMKNDVLGNLNISLSIISIREFRMMKRIEELRSSGSFTVTQIDHEKGRTEKGSKDIKKKTKMAVLGQIQAIEEALTKVQEKKARMLELKVKLETSNKPDDVPHFERYVKALEKTAKEVWGEEDEE